MPPRRRPGDRAADPEARGAAAPEPAAPPPGGGAAAATGPAGSVVLAAAAALRETLPAQRWFGRKDRVVAEVTPVDHAAVPGSDGVLALYEVAFTDGARDRYCVPVRPPGPREGGFVDAMADPAFCLALAEVLRRGLVLAGGRGVFRALATPALPEILPGPPAASKPVGGEQSNTSVSYDGRAILKLLRRLEAGPSPELELTDLLTRQGTFPASPRLGGAIQYEAAEGPEPVTLAVLHEFVPNEGDAWTATLERLEEYLTAAVEGPGEEPPDPVFARALAAADAREAGRLGQLTARLHAALAAAPPGSALAPEPIEAADTARWLEGMLDQLGRGIAALDGASAHLSPDARAPARRVADGAPRLAAGLRAIEGLAGSGVVKLRIHGDYHLGQLVRTAGGFAILDFEGEPARPLAERRAKQCALKDVAGMLRSFGYAAQVALARRVEGSLADRHLAERLRPWAQAWEDGVRTAFLEGYLQEARAQAPGIVPAHPALLEGALRAYEVDKALYELRYEIANRPAWVGVPLAALERALAPAPPPAAGRLRPGEGPFAFVACLELREFVGVRAENERQLAELLDEVPLDSTYYHTHGFLLRHRFLAGVYPNDFATWVDREVRDRVLGERLAMVDPADFPTLQALREELVSVVDEHLRRLPVVPGIVSGEPFDFIQSRIVEVPTGIEVRTLPELREALLEIDPSALFFHLVEARLRLGRGRNDFAAWLELGLGLPALAARVQAVSPYTGSLEQARARLIAILDEALAEGTGR
jgi:trehalose synthase-fused probable maltokinase